MGIYGQIDKIEQLLEAHGIDTGFPSGVIPIKQLPEKYRNALLQFGYTDEGLFWGVNSSNSNGKTNVKFTLAMINGGDSIKKWTDLLYRDVDRNWWYHINENEYTNKKDGLEELRKEVDYFYKSFQKLFMFLDVYIKQREQMVKLVNIEYDNLQSSLETKE